MRERKAGKARRRGWWRGEGSTYFCGFVGVLGEIQHHQTHVDIAHKGLNERVWGSQGACTSRVVVVTPSDHSFHRKIEKQGVKKKRKEPPTAQVQGLHTTTTITTGAAAAAAAAQNNVIL